MGRIFVLYKDNQQQIELSLQFARDNEPEELFGLLDPLYHFRQTRSTANVGLDGNRCTISWNTRRGMKWPEVLPLVTTKLQMSDYPPDAVMVHNGGNFIAINCTADSDCTSSVTNAVCDNKKCNCTGVFKVNGSACATKGLGDTCSNTTDCRNVTNASCGISKTCVCASAFKETGRTTCAKKGLGDSCTTDKDCTGVTNGHCHKRDHKCSCSDGFKSSGSSCVAKVIGSVCVASNKTLVCTKASYTDCIAGHCACLDSYTEENDQCKKAAGGTCKVITDCHSNANCSKTCMCTKGHSAENGLCLVVVGTACSKASDCVSNADCGKTTKKCQCVSGYVPSSGLCSQKSSANTAKWTFSVIVVSFLLVVYGPII